MSTNRRTWCTSIPKLGRSRGVWGAGTPRDGNVEWSPAYSRTGSRAKGDYEARECRVGVKNPSYWRRESEIATGLWNPSLLGT